MKPMEVVDNVDGDVYDDGDVYADGDDDDDDGHDEHGSSPWASLRN